MDDGSIEASAIRCRRYSNIPSAADLVVVNHSKSFSRTKWPETDAQHRKSPQTISPWWARTCLSLRRSGSGRRSPIGSDLIQSRRKAVLGAEATPAFDHSPSDLISSQIVAAPGIPSGLLRKTPALVSQEPS